MEKIILTLFTLAMFMGAFQKKEIVPGTDNDLTKTASGFLKNLKVHIHSHILKELFKLYGYKNKLQKACLV